MRKIQTVIVRWMGAQLDRRRWSAERWAREADLAPTTVTRAMSKAYKSVSSVPTLHALARAAGVPSIIDFLDGQAALGLNYPIVTAMLAEILPAAGCKASDETVVMLGEALGQAISGMFAQPSDKRNDIDVARALARAAYAAVIADRIE